MKKTFSALNHAGRFSLLGLLFLATAALPLTAAEKGGLLVDIQKKIVNRNDKTTGDEIRPVDRTMSLRLAVKNTAMKDMPATTVEYTVLIQRWGSETGNLERYQGGAKLDTIPMSHNIDVLIGNFHIGGHLHGSAEMHVDKFVAWKVVINRDGQKLDFESTPSFDAMSKKAAAGH